jgi:hypothetical protein
MAMTTDERLAELAGAVAALSSRMDERLNRVDERFDRVDERFDRVDARFDRQDEYILKFRSEVIVRFEAVEQKVGLLALTVGSLDSRMPGLTQAVMDFGARSHNSTADLAARVAKLEEQVSKLLAPAA